MFAVIKSLKTSLGISLTETDVIREAKLISSLEMANAMIAGYIGADLSDTEKEYSYTTVLGRGISHINLPVFPVLEIISVTNDGVLMASTDYTILEASGILSFGSAYGYGDCVPGQRKTVLYRAGFEEIPIDLAMVALNMSAAIYNMGGSFSSAATTGSGALKSLTMFDAMSMSFETGSSGAEGESSNSPAGMLRSWAFVLDHYRVNAPVLA